MNEGGAARVDRQEQLVCDLLIFLAERTGLDRMTLARVLDANEEFWEHHRADIMGGVEDEEE